MILCLETSASICSVAIGRDSHTPIALQESTSFNDHASMIMKHVDNCIQEAKINLRDLQGVAISQGPGSFTGLRVGVAAAKAICFALNIPLIAVSTLEALAQAAFSQHPEADYCSSMIEARKEEVYGAIFDRSMRLIEPEQVISLFPQWHYSVLERGVKIIFCGSGSQLYQQISPGDRLFIVDVAPSAVNLLKPAFRKHIKKDYCIAESFKPNYLKEAHITKARKVL
jgi:tRNA threonylcarbamoyladenosine biosynthesis protein TsaB